MNENGDAYSENCGSVRIVKSEWFISMLACPTHITFSLKVSRSLFELLKTGKPLRSHSSSARFK